MKVAISMLPIGTAEVGNIAPGIFHLGSYYRLRNEASIIIAVLSIGIFSLLAHPAHIG